MIKIGIDIVVISRIETLIKKYGIEKLRFLNNDEKYTSSPSTIAGIFASKEAFSKALGVGIGKEFSFEDISIIKNSKNKPLIKIHSPTLKKKIIQSDVSITHDGGFAISAVILKLKEIWYNSTLRPRSSAG